MKGEKCKLSAQSKYIYMHSKFYRMRVNYRECIRQMICVPRLKDLFSQLLRKYYRENKWRYMHQQLLHDLVLQLIGGATLCQRHRESPKRSHTISDKEKKHQFYVFQNWKAVIRAHTLTHVAGRSILKI
jgi:hypothetical protein